MEVSPNKTEQLYIRGELIGIEILGAHCPTRELSGCINIFAVTNANNPDRDHTFLDVADNCSKVLFNGRETLL